MKLKPKALDNNIWAEAGSTLRIMMWRTTAWAHPFPKIWRPVSLAKEWAAAWFHLDLVLTWQSNSAREWWKSKRTKSRESANKLKSLKRIVSPWKKSSHTQPEPSCSLTLTTTLDLKSITKLWQCLINHSLPISIIGQVTLRVLDIQTCLLALEARSRTLSRRCRNHYITKTSSDQANPAITSVMM